MFISIVAETLQIAPFLSELIWELVICFTVVTMYLAFKFFKQNADDFMTKKVKLIMIVYLAYFAFSIIAPLFTSIFSSPGKEVIPDESADLHINAFTILMLLFTFIFLGVKI